MGKGDEVKMKSLSFCQFLGRLLDALFAVRDIPVGCC